MVHYRFSLSLLLPDDPAPKTHIFLGRAFVDLVPLQYGLRNLVGWYNVVDLAGELHGQLKVGPIDSQTLPKPIG